MLCVAAAVILWRYPLTAARHAEIRAQLLQKEAIAGSRTLPAAQNDLATTAER
jgi:Na+/melibiose symporter-like transporter